MKNESITGFCGKCATRTDADAAQKKAAGTNGDIFSLVVKSGDNNKITGHQ